MSKNFSVKAHPYYIIEVDSYHYTIETLIDYLRSLGVRVQIFNEISLQKICRYSGASKKIKPWILETSKPELSPQDVVELIQLHKLTYDFDAILKLLADLATADHDFHYVAPLKCYAIKNHSQEESVEDFQWFFCLIRKIADQVFVHINDWVNGIDPSPRIPANALKVIGFRHL